MWFRLLLLAVLAMLVACSDVGERNNPTDPFAVNYDPTILFPAPSSSSGMIVKRASWNYLNTKVTYGFFVDKRDNLMYRTVSLKGNVWLAENISYKSGKCFDDDTTLCDKYGRLYTWKEASTACPEGYHLPTKTEWNSLVGVDSLMADKGWLLDNGKSGGSNKTGFSVLPGGRYVSVKGGGVDTGYTDLAHAAYFWTATKTSSGDSAEAVLFSSVPARWSKAAPRNDRYSVRCVGDSATTFVPLSSSSSSETKKSSSSSHKARAVESSLPCGDMWCGPELDYNVSTGFGSKDVNEGVWFYYLDDGSEGNSYFEFPKPVKEDNTGYEDIINECGGICGSAHFGSKYEYPYLGLAFFIVDTPENMVDITSWKGICVSYTSDASLYVGLHPSDSIQAVMEYDDFVSTLPKSKAGSVLDIPWSSFDQLGWGAAYDRDVLLKQISAIVFVFKDKAAGTVVNFNIVSVGRIGTCTRY